MKIIMPILIATFLSTGCSTSINTWGRHKSLLDYDTNRSEIIDVLGSPKETQDLEKGHHYGAKYSDIYEVYGKVGKQMLAYEHEGMVIGCTFFLAEAILLPKALINASIDLFSWQEVEVLYDEENNYNWHYVRRKND